MGREVRRVPADWQHPRDAKGHYIPLYDGKHLADELREWDEGAAKWAEGLRDDFAGGWKPREPDDGMTYEDWAGSRNEPSEYTPAWPDEQRTHLMMYEDVSEGTPISPAFKTPEELARWLTDNNASAVAYQTATYEQWLAMIHQGYAMCGVGTSTGWYSGVEAASWPKKGAS